MVHFIAEPGQATLRFDITDLKSFRRWIDSADCPDEANVWYIKGEVYVDMSKEQIFSHVLVKTEITAVLRTIVKSERLGLYLTDGLLLSNFAAEISGNPDGTFISQATLRSDRIRLLEGQEGGYAELQGTPDMVLEIISKSSINKDTVLLRQGYWDAGIPEYWLVDARKPHVQFTILRRTARGYVATRKQDGWIKSAVFGKSFQLSQQTNELGHPEYALAVQ